MVEMKKLKNSLRKTAFSSNATRDDRAKFYEALHTYNFLRREQNANKKRRSTKFEESKFRKNFWSFSRNAVNDTLYSTASEPTFSRESANDYFSAKYATQPTPIDTDKLDWWTGPKPDDIQHLFDMGPIRPKDIKQVLGSRSSNSAPGPDGISYGILKKLPSIHHFLATLYSKLLLNQNPTPTLNVD